MTIVEADTPERIAAIRDLFREYAVAIGVDLEFQGFSGELATLPGAYAPPAGALLLATEGGRPLGCVALRPLDGGACEMKRLYVAPAGRGQGIGRRLAEAIAARARVLGYARMRLDTLASMQAARQLYRSLGFRPINAYYDNPLPGAEFYEREL